MRALPCAVLLLAPVLIAAQGEKEKWQRVYTGEDSIIEMELTKVTFGSASIGRVRFRTTFSKPQTLNEKPVVKYKSRLETIEFKCEMGSVRLGHYPANTTRYRLFEATLLDARGKVVKSLDWDPSEDWREVRFGSMMEKLSYPACKLIEEKRRNP